MKSNIFFMSVLMSIFMVFVFLVNVGSVGATSVSTSPNAIPSNVLYYVPITVTANGPVVANAQVMFSFLKNTYSSYESHNLQNIEFFYSNGTIIPSWFERESLSPSLSSLSVSYWLKIANPNFLPTTGSSNTVYMGFGSTSTNFFNGNTVGESPLLSSTYGKYDNGQNVFSYYQSFGGLSGNSLPAGWISVNNSPNGQITNAGYNFNTVIINNPENTLIYVSNDMSGGCGCGIFANALSSMSPGNTIEWYGNIYNNQMAGTFAGIETINSNVAFPLPLYTWNYEAGYAAPQINVLTYGLSELVTSTGQSGTITMGASSNDQVPTGVTDTNVNKVYGIQINSPNSFNAILNYESIGQDTNTQITGNQIFAFSVGLNPAGKVLSSPQSIYWIRTRTNTQQPTLNFGSVTPIPLTVNLTVTPNPVFNGSDVGFVASANGGVSPYTYNFIVYNSNSISNTLLTSSGFSSSNTFGTSINNVGNYLAQVEVMDSSSPSNAVAFSANIPFSAITFNGIVLTSNVMTIDLGQSVNIGVNDINSQSNGNDAFSLNLYNSIVPNTPILFGTGLEKDMPYYMAFTPNVIGNVIFTVNGNMFYPDSNANIPNTNVTIKVNPALSISAANSGSSVTTGSAETLTATVNGGTSPYSYQWYSISGSTNTIISGATSSTYSPSTSSTGSFTYGVNVIDAANAVAYSNPISFTVTSPTTTTITTGGPISTGGLPPTTAAVTTVAPVLVPTTTPITTTPPVNQNKPSNVTTNTTSANTIKTSATNKTVSTNATKNTTTTVKQAVTSTSTAFPWWIILLIIIIIILLILYWYMRRKKHQQHHNHMQKK